jgi:hypothetical protein
MLYHLPKGITMNGMNDPTYTRDHPELGVAGKEFIYRYADESGATVNWRYAVPGYHVAPVRFTGVEITSFVVVGAIVTYDTVEEVNAYLDNLASLAGAGKKIDAANDEDPHRGETAEEKKHRLAAEKKAKHDAEKKVDAQIEAEVKAIMDEQAKEDMVADADAVQTHEGGETK